MPAGLALLFAGAAAVAGAQGRDQDQWEYRPARAMQARLIARLGRSGPTVRLIGSPDFTAFDFRVAATFALRRHGLRVLDPAASVRLDDSYGLDATPYQATVRVSTTTERSADRQTIALIAAHGPRGHTLLVTLEPAALERRKPVRR